MPPGTDTQATREPHKALRSLCPWEGLPSRSSSTISCLGLLWEGPGPLIPWLRYGYLQEMDRLSLESMMYVSSVMFRVGGVME